mmetsp:Transcript_11648/g.23001  ORF Transcript_11648/g.23001 Transcript_11648/m.23001 type:complete len:335 (-) Transcript_11648:709-1713(-)
MRPLRPKRRLAPLQVQLAGVAQGTRPRPQRLAVLGGIYTDVLVAHHLLQDVVESVRVKRAHGPGGAQPHVDLLDPLPARVAAHPRDLNVVAQLRNLLKEGVLRQVGCRRCPPLRLPVAHSTLRHEPVGYGAHGAHAGDKGRRSITRARLTAAPHDILVEKVIEPHHPTDSPRRIILPPHLHGHDPQPRDAADVPEITPLFRRIPQLREPLDQARLLGRHPSRELLIVGPHHREAHAPPDRVLFQLLALPRGDAGDPPHRAALRAGDRRHSRLFPLVQPLPLPVYIVRVEVRRPPPLARAPPLEGRQGAPRAPRVIAGVGGGVVAHRPQGLLVEL